MLALVIIGGKEKTVRALALAALGSDGVPRLVATDASGSLGGSTGPRSPSATCPESVIVGDQTLVVDVAIGVGQKSDGTLAFVGGDSNQNLQ